MIHIYQGWRPQQQQQQQHRPSPSAGGIKKTIQQQKRRIKRKYKIKLDPLWQSKSSTQSCYMALIYNNNNEKSSESRRGGGGEETGSQEARNGDEKELPAWNV